MRILHLASRSAWEEALRTGEYSESTRDASLADVGFMHMSTAAQVPGVASRYYADVDLSTQLLLVVEPDLCEAAGAPLRWDAVEGSADPFPHIYGPIPVAAVVAQLEVGRDADGTLLLPDLSGLDVA
ncbi:uncharacterized protein SAMN05892883_0110 [Jatrophihabitans sp. GAS493]|uniref:DUF952 domain-containing protein n=1 Tax=Jatrophihabitans sp. GAS493 TaxID=1907575 RepID=UPI000BB90BD2|nr:DUF952 domain-containing protein [Jatrophihabitans sp. GAS493]SOD70408.1 uncharacterized protein SAMN05892883_0110 [Jatrophihabitans sp. GAS493]